MMQNNIQTSHFFAACIIFLFFVFDFHGHAATEGSKTIIPIGLILDLDSPLGSMADLCMKMALSDFYSTHQNYTTKLELHVKNANSVLDANLAALELFKQEDVHGIIGPQESSQAQFFTELGAKFHVPIISFTARSSNVQYKEKNYFIRTTPDDAIQAKALAAICKGFEWPNVVLLYEDTDYGNQFLSHVNKAFQEVEIGLEYTIAISESIENIHLLKELEKLKTKQTRIFLVHMNPLLGFRLFALAKGTGVMSKGYAWIITDSLSSFINSINFASRNSMEGVLGIRPFVPRSQDLKSFQERWKRNMIMKNASNLAMELNVYGLWAYDAVTALAIAVEKIVNTNTNETTISTFGPRLVDEFSRTKFKGLSGDFELVDGKLKPSMFEILNVIGTGEKTIGYWSPERGIKQLKNIIWPGDSITRPTGWSIPATGNLRVGIPCKPGFTEFVNSTTDPSTKHTNAHGFSIDIFLAALQVLPFPIDHEFRVYNDCNNTNWSYDDMLDKIPKIYDIVVGDTTIWAPRAKHVDFSMPYSESGVVLVVRNRKPFDMWIFIKPLRWDLWLAIFLACILMGIVLRILERREIINDPDLTKEQNRLPGMVYWSPVTILAFPESNILTSNT